MDELNISERVNLEIKLKKTKDLSEWKRLFAILGYDDGKSVEELAEMLRLSCHTIESYLRDYNSNNKTKNDPRGGSESKLTEDQSQSLQKHLLEKTYLKVKHIIGYVYEQFQVKYSRSGMTTWLVNLRVLLINALRRCQESLILRHKYSLLQNMRS